MKLTCDAWVMLENDDLSFSDRKKNISVVESASWLKWRRADPSFSVCILWFTDTDLTQSIPLVILYRIQVPVVSEEPSTHTILFSLTGTRTEDIHAWVLFSNNHTSFAGTKLESCLWRRTLRGCCRGRSSSLIVFATSFKRLLSSFMAAGGQLNCSCILLLIRLLLEDASSLRLLRKKSR